MHRQLRCSLTAAVFLAMRPQPRCLMLSTSISLLPLSLAIDTGVANRKHRNDTSIAKLNGMGRKEGRAIVFASLWWDSVRWWATKERGYTHRKYRGANGSRRQKKYIIKLWSLFCERAEWERWCWGGASNRQRATQLQCVRRPCF